MSSLLVAESVCNGFSSVKNMVMFVKKKRTAINFLQKKHALYTLATDRLGLCRIRLQKCDFWTALDEQMILPVVYFVFI